MKKQTNGAKTRERNREILGKWAGRRTEREST